MARGEEVPPLPHGPVWRSALAVLALVAGGASIYRVDQRRTRSVAESEIAVVGRLKAEKIVRWRNERLAGASVLMDNRGLATDVAAFLPTAGQDLRQEAQDFLRSLQKHYGYSDVLVSDLSGNVRWSLSGRVFRLHGAALAGMNAALARRQAALSELHSGPGTSPLHLDAIVPLYGQEPKPSLAVGIVVFQIPAERDVFPMVAAWPRPSASAETLLVRREGDEAVFLSARRHQNGSTWPQRLPLTATEVPAVKAALGETGVFEGIDYRGAAVLASITPVEGSNWRLVSKIDASEAFAPARARALFMAGLVALASLAAGLAFVAAQQHARREHFERMHDADRSRVASETRYRSLFEHLHEGYAHCRMLFEDGHPQDWIYLAVNPAFERVTKLENAVGHRVTEIVPGIRESNPELFAVYGRVAASGGHETFETYVEPLRVWFHVSVYSPAQGEFVAVFDDVSDRKRAEEALRSSEGQLRAMFELASIGIAQADPASGRWLRVNQKMCEITGYTADELTALHVPDITHPDDRAADRELFDKVVRGDTPSYRLEKRYLRKDGSEKWVSVNMTVVRDASGKPLRTVAAIEDIDERKRAEQALRASEAFTRTILDNLPIGIAVNAVDPSVAFTYVNDSFLRCYRTTPERLKGSDAFWEAAYEDPAARQAMRERVLQDCASGDPARMRWDDVPITRHGEETSYVSAQNIPIAGTSLMISMVWDVTERMRAEAERERLARHRQLALDAAHLGWWHYDPLTRISTWDDRYKEIFGVAGHERPNDEILKLLDPDDLPRVWAAVEEALDPTQPRPYAVEYRVNRADGVQRWVEAHGIATFEGEGTERRATSFVGTVEDVTDRKLADEALRLAHERLRRFIDANVIGVIVADAAGAILQANDYYLGLVGFSHDALTRGEIDWRTLTPAEWLPADEKALRELRERGTCTPYEKEYLRRDGTRIPVLLADVLLPGPREEIAAFVVDLSELKHAEHALRESEERYRTVAEFTYDWEYWRGTDGRMLYVSPSCERVTGYPARAFLDAPGLADDIIHPDDRAVMATHHAGAAASVENRSSVDFRILHRDGSERWMSHSCLPVFDRDGHHTGRRGSNRDITERKRVEAALRRSELRLRLAQDAAQAGAWEWDLTTNENAWSDELWKLYGLDPARHQASYETWLGSMHPEDRERAAQAVWEAAGSGRELSAEWRVLAPDGAVRWLMSRGQPVLDAAGRPTRYVGIVIDITERKNTEAVLRQRLELQDQIAKIATAVPGMIYSFRLRPDGSACMPFCTSRIEELWGLTAKEVREDFSPAFARIHPDDVARVRATVAESARVLGPWRDAFRVLHPQKGERWLEGHSLPRREPDGSVLWQGFVQDVSERKHAEEEAAQSRAKLDAALASMTDAVFISDREGRFVEFNDAFANFHRFKSKQECARTLAEYPAFLDVYLPDGTPAPLEEWAVRRALRGETGTNAEYSLRRRDTGEAWVGSYSFAPIRDEHGAIVGSVVAGRDVTEKKRVEDEIRRLNEELEERVRSRTAQLEATNRELESFSYSVSHDLRAPLRGIDGWSLALLEDYGPRLDAQAREYLTRVRSDTQRMGQLIDDMLRLARVSRATLLPTEVDLSALVAKILDRLRAADPQREVETSVEPGVKVRGDAGLLEMLLSNLLDNAWKFTAQRRPGHVSFGVGVEEGERVFFVRDDGVGFDMAFAGKLFGVFQRLHKQSEFPGTGIGLATVQRIVHRHGGRIWADSAVDRGTTISFTLPEARA